MRQYMWWGGGGGAPPPPTTAFISSSPIQRQIFTGFFPGAAQGMQRHMRRGNIYMSVFGQRGIFLRPQENGFRHQMLRKQSPGVDHPPPGNARSPLSHDSTHHARVTSHQVSNRTICHHVPFRHAFDSSQNFFHTQILHSTSPQHIPLQKHVVRHTLPIRQHARCLIKEADPHHRELSLAHLNKLHRPLPNIRQSGCAPSEKPGAHPRKDDSHHRIRSHVYSGAAVVHRKHRHHKSQRGNHNPQHAEATRPPVPESTRGRPQREQQQNDHDQ